MSEKTLVEQLRSAEMKGQFGLGFGQIASCIETRYTPNSEIEAKYMAYPLDADGVPCRLGDYVRSCETFGLIKEMLLFKQEKTTRWEIYLTTLDDSVSADSLHHAEPPKPDTQERIDDDATMPPRRYYSEKIGNDVDIKDDEEVFTAVALSLMSRQRELDARTMGGE